MKILAGIDYSLTSPSVCVYNDDGSGNWNSENCKFYYIVKTDKQIIKTNTFDGYKYPNYTSDSERYDELSKWVEKIVIDNGVNECYIERIRF